MNIRKKLSRFVPGNKNTSTRTWLFMIFHTVFQRRYNSTNQRWVLFIGSPHRHGEQQGRVFANTTSSRSDCKHPDEEVCKDGSTHITWRRCQSRHCRDLWMEDSHQRISTSLAAVVCCVVFQSSQAITAI